jgi:Flp pilus assembly protein TadG
VHPRRRLVEEDGSEAVEFALLLPLLLLVLLAAVQVGVLARDQLVLSQASRAGAREAAVNADDAGIREAVNGAASGLDPARLTVEVTREGSQGEPVTVVVGYDAGVATILSGWLMPPEVHLVSAATMRQEIP